MIEVDDAQASDFAGIDPLGVWRRILDVEPRATEQPTRLLVIHD